MTESSQNIANSEFSTTAEFPGEHRSVVRIADSVVTLHEPLQKACGRVVLVPGWAGPRSGPADILVFLASAISKAGWRVLRLDIPARGDADGDRAAIGLDEMIDSALTVASSDGEDGSRTVFLGMCSGGNVSLGAVTLALETEDAGVALANAGVIALSILPFQPSRSKDIERRRTWENIKQYAGKAASPQTWLRLIKGDINLDRVKKNVTTSEKPADGARNLKDSDRDIEKALQQWKGAGLFIWGGGDEEAGLARAHFEKLHTAGAGDSTSQFHTIPGANHNYYSRAWRAELAEKIVGFLTTFSPQRHEGAKNG